MQWERCSGSGAVGVVKWEWGDAPYLHLIYKRLLLPNLIITDFSLVIQTKTTLQIRACSTKAKPEDRLVNAAFLIYLFNLPLDV